MRDAHALAPPPSRRLNGAQVHVLIDDEWVPVPGIASVEITGGWADDPTPSETANPPEPPMPCRRSRAVRRGNRARPAWQTPYGPATRHH
jgi:hypothetical protein